METSPSSPAGPDEPPPPAGQPWALPLVLAVGLTLAGWLLLTVRDVPPLESTGKPTAESSPQWTPPPAEVRESVALEIDFGNGVRREFAALPWQKGMTVGDLLRLARQIRPGLDYAHDGKGAMSFLTSIDGVRNQGPGGRCWLYEVDGREADVSYEIEPLAPGQRVLWIFAEPE